MGQYDLAEATFRKLQEINPDSGLSYGALVSAYTFLNRLDQAKQMAKEVQAREPDSPDNHINLRGLLPGT